jgi:alkanesulfonate monooxygenase SsuD/methylene tetrahydromethanopterin reductase-like flavin-dependent oxidoreductase (luciferase family)
MKYGLTLPNGGPWGDARTLADLARLSEDSGWEGLFLEDYIVWQGHQHVATHDPWVALAAIAMQTRRIRIGTSVTALPRRRPWKVAREAVSLDHLSNGRMVLGVGLGDIGDNAGTDLSFTHFAEQTNAKVRAEMLDEALTIIAGLWTGEPFSFAGQHYQVQAITFLPRPVQTPRIPIWVGGGFPLRGPARRAARWDGACLYKVKTHFMQPEDIRALQALVREHHASLDDYDIIVGGAQRDPDPASQLAYMRSVAEAGATWWVEYVGPDAGDLAYVRQLIGGGPIRVD